MNTHGIPVGAGMSLTARSALSRIGRNAGGARHCWVRDPPEASGTWPGLLVAWARSSSGTWNGRVVYAVVKDGEVILVEAWLDSAHLSAA